MTSPPSPRVVDAHSDLLIELAFAEVEHGEANPMRSRWLTQLQDGGVALQVCAIYVEPHYVGHAALVQALRLARAFHDAVDANADRLIKVHDGKSLGEVGAGRVGMLLALEGVDCLGTDDWLIDVLVRCGVRMASLTHNRANAFAAGCDAAGGLTDLGARLVDRMVRLGVAVDLAHASEQTFWDTLARMDDRPAVVSHASCRALYDHPRNLSDDQLRALGGVGGVVGLMPHPFVIDPTGADVRRFADHLDHAVGVAGIEHVGLGGDFLQQIARAMRLPDPAPNVAIDAAVEGLAGPADYPRLAEELRHRGYAEDAVVAVMGGNLLRALGRWLPTA
jgi:membrane dipeptidase